MARLLRIGGAKRPWPEVRAAIEAATSRRFPAADVTVDDEPSIRWHDGPAEASVAEAVGELPGWRFAVALAGPDGAGAPAGDDRRSPIWLRRTFSDEALAVAVVRFQASAVRPFDSTREGAEARLRDLLDVDDPATSGYPLTDTMAALLLADPPAPDDVSPTRADAWSRRLTELGYDRLWNRAYAEAPI
ncbi:MAG: hypothetical protein JNK12_07195 [Acidimicrobiales bacterium]|nr:hypothetical protein [Acidimicrobiales bacterium]